MLNIYRLASSVRLSSRTARSADPEELRKFGKAHGAAQLMVPGDIVKVDEIPVLGSGKTDYVAARGLAISRLGLGEAA